MPLIVFEGIDGSGTTTISKRVAENYTKLGRETIWTCEPTTDIAGKLFREIFEGKHGELPSWRAMMHLIQADREMHVERIKGALTKGQFVICDRYWLSTLVYQSVSADTEKDVAQKLITTLNVHIPQPDVTLILDVEVEEAQRRRNRPADLFEKNEFLKKVREAYLEVRGMQVRRIYTTGKDEEAVYQEVEQQLKESGF